MSSGCGSASLNPTPKNCWIASPSLTTTPKHLQEDQESSFLTKCELKENIKNYSLVASGTSSPNNFNKNILVNSAPGTVVGGSNFGILNQQFDGSVSPNMSLNPLNSARKIMVNDFVGSEPISRNDEDLVTATKTKPLEMQTIQ